MAKKKQEIALQKEILNDEQWEESVIGHKGVMVVDAYQKWAGPCKATVAMFRRIKNEMQDDLLAFAVAESDSINDLQFYRGKCEPTFLFYAGGKLQGKVRGCNAPSLERTITEQLAKEHKVQDGSAQRTEFIDPELEAQMRAEQQAAEEAARPKPQPKVCSVMVIKPDAVEQGQTEEILEKLREQGIEIVQSEERQLTDEEAREMYSAQQDEPYFEELIEFMTRGPCHVVLVTKGPTGEEVIPELRELVGPTDANEAKETKPETLRALYGTDKLVNGVHAADSKDQAARELAFFFPDADLPLQEQVEQKPLQRTLAIIRPDAYRERGQEILDSIKGSGFQIVMMKEMSLSREQASEFYREHEDEEFFELLVQNMISGPLLALALAREDAIGKWRGMLGPKEKEAVKEHPESLRAQFDVEEVPINQIHGSDSEQSAQRELDFFFPQEKTLAVIKPNAIDKKEEIMERIRGAGFKVSTQKQSRLTREMAGQFYSEHEGKEFYDQLVDFMSSGDSLFLVLAREDAVNGFREMCGNKNPEEAKQEKPDSIRAIFGDDLLKNAIHSSSNIEQANEKIMKIFDEEEMQQAEEGEAPAEEAAGAEQAEQQEEAATGDAEAAPEGEAAVEGEAAGESAPGDAKPEDAEQAAAEGEDKPAEKQEQKDGEEKPAEEEASAPEAAADPAATEDEKKDEGEAAPAAAEDADKPAEDKPDEPAAAESPEKPEEADAPKEDSPAAEESQEQKEEEPSSEEKPEASEANENEETGNKEEEKKE